MPQHWLVVTIRQNLEAQYATFVTLADRLIRHVIVIALVLVLVIVGVIALVNVIAIVSVIVVVLALAVVNGKEEEG